MKRQREVRTILWGFLFSLGLVFLAFWMPELSGSTALSPGVISALSWLPLVGLPPLLAIFVDTMGMDYALAKVCGPRPFVGLLVTRFSTEGIAPFVPGGVLAGDAMKPWLLEKTTGLPLGEGVAVTLFRKFLRLLAQGLSIGLALVWVSPHLPYLSERVLGRPGLGLLVLFCASLLLAAAMLFRATLKGASWIARLCEHTAKFRSLAWLKRPLSALGSADRSTREFFSQPLRTLVVPLACATLAWLLEALEVWLALLVMGYEKPLAVVVMLELSLGLLRQVLVFVPLGVGVHEGGYFLLFSALGVDSPWPASAAMACMRRSRELAFGLISAFLLVRLGQWAKPEVVPAVLAEPNRAGSPSKQQAGCLSG